VLLWGPFDPATAGAPAAWLQPFAADPPPANALLGVQAPWPDRTYRGALAHERWIELPLPILAGIINELARVADRAVFLVGASPSTYGPRAVFSQAASIVAVDWTMTRAGSATAFVATARQAGTSTA
jgi:hypothetical protein